MTRLFTYVLPVDDGAAPNPYWDMCTLAIRKPRIRAAAKVGDWIAGIGSREAPAGDLSRMLVYAMCVTNKLTMEEYDEYCRSELVRKIPTWNHRDWRRRLGDCLYDFATDPPKLRRGVQEEADLEADLGGKHVLLSRRFHYLGDRPIELPDHLLEIADIKRGHRSNSNERFVGPMVDWIERLRLPDGSIFGMPQFHRFDGQRGRRIGFPERRNPGSQVPVENDRRQQRWGHCA